jgi:hypothetical protein
MARTVSAANPTWRATCRAAAGSRANPTASSNSLLNLALLFPDVDYGALPGSDKACADFNGGGPCSPVEGHDPLLGVASTSGDFNVAWHVKLAVVTQLFGGFTYDLGTPVVIQYPPTSYSGG